MCLDSDTAIVNPSRILTCSITFDIRAAITSVNDVIRSDLELGLQLVERRDLAIARRRSHEAFNLAGGIVR